MTSNRGRVLMMMLLLLGSAVLFGCSRVHSVVQAESRSEENTSADRVVRATANADDKAEAKKDAAEGEKEGFRFPNDKGGELLTRVLTPAVDGAAVAERRHPPHRPAVPAGLDSPTMLLQPPQAVMPRAALESKRPVLMPRLVIDETLSEGGSPALPSAQSFATGDKSKDTGIDVNQPPPLPVLSQPVPDRASLEDPTADASLIAAVAATVPLREVQVSFQRQSIPDPFENHTPVRLNNPPAEEIEPPLGPARNPKP